MSIMPVWLLTISSCPIKSFPKDIPPTATSWFAIATGWWLMLFPVGKMNPTITIMRRGMRMSITTLILLLLNSSRSFQQIHALCLKTRFRFMCSPHPALCSQLRRAVLPARDRRLGHGVPDLMSSNTQEDILEGRFEIPHASDLGAVLPQ